MYGEATCDAVVVDGPIFQELVRVAEFRSREPRIRSTGQQRPAPVVAAAEKNYEFERAHWDVLHSITVDKK